ncbi:MAG: AI-2E family transporter [Candidatus Paceibacterota bacterium]
MFNVQNSSKAFDISWGALVKVALAVMAVYFLYLVKDILFWVVSGLIISILFNPAIGFLQKIKISRGGATTLVYSSALAVLFFLIYWVSPIVKSEVYNIAQDFPQYFNSVAPFFSGLGFDVFQNADAFFGALRGWLIKISTSGLFGSVTAIFGGFFLTVTIFSMAIFFSLEEDGIKKAIKLLLPRKYESAAIGFWERTQIKISGWFAARILSMIFVGVAVALLCIALGIQYPIFFGIFAFITDLIPFIGPLVFGVVLSLFALINSWQTALAVGVGVLIIHQIEGNIITPVLTKKFMEFPVSLVLVSLLVGERLWGIMGAILAIPLFGIIYDFTHEFLEKNKD